MVHQKDELNTLFNTELAFDNIKRYETVNGIKLIQIDNPKSLFCTYYMHLVHSLIVIIQKNI